MTGNKKVCRSCRKNVDTQARKCPHCQEDLRSWFRRHPILTFLLLIFLFPTFTGLFAPSESLTPKENPTKQIKTQEEIEKEEQEKKIAAEEAEKNQKQAMDGYMTLINTSGMSEYVSGIEVSGGNLTVVVRNVWHYQPKQVRFQAAQTLWESWVMFCPEKDADRCRLKLEDLNGNRVGGSSWLAGSVIEVDD